MERDEESKQLLDQAFSAGDDWLRKQGVVTNFTLNTIIVFVYSNFPQIKNVDIDLDKQNNRIYIKLYASLWMILLWMLLRRRQKLIDLVFNWVQEYIPMYKISVELRRSTIRREDEIKQLNPSRDTDDGDDLPELEGVANLSNAIKLNEVPLYNSEDSSKTTTKITEE
jgi:hypothetical protein